MPELPPPPPPTGAIPSGHRAPPSLPPKARRSAWFVVAMVIGGLLIIALIGSMIYEAAHVRRIADRLAEEHGCIGIAPYWEYRGGFFNAKGVPIPEAITVFPDEQYQAPLSWAETAYPRLTYFTEVDNGGHFAAWEQPELFSQEIRAAFRSLR